MEEPTRPFLANFWRTPVKAPGESMTCPGDLAAMLELNGLIVDNTTRTDGQCGLHAFLISLTDAKHRFRHLASSGAWKQLSGAKEVSKKLIVLRALALRWIKENQKTNLWDGVTLEAFVRASMTDEVKTFSDYLDKMATQDYWIDGAVLHALGNIFKVDIVIMESQSNTSFVGYSLGDKSPASSVPLVPVALANDRHFWGLQQKDFGVDPVFDDHDRSCH